MNFSSKANCKYRSRSERILPNANRLRTKMKYFRIQGDDLQKDFDNLEVLSTLMSNLVYSISAAGEQGIETAEHSGSRTN